MSYSVNKNHQVSVLSAQAHLPFVQETDTAIMEAKLSKAILSQILSGQEFSA